MSAPPREVKWDVVAVASGLVRVDVYEESLGDEYRGSVLLDASQAKRLATDLAMASADAETMERRR